jgi:hypothetical protein
MPRTSCDLVNAWFCFSASRNSNRNGDAISPKRRTKTSSGQDMRQGRNASPPRKINIDIASRFCVKSFSRKTFDR